MNKTIKIEDRVIGSNYPCFVIGEIGSNHCLDKKVVKDLIDAAANAKFDAVKFQIYDAKEAFSANETTSDVKLDHLYGNRPWWEVARDKILMPRDWFGEMFKYARSKNLIPFSAIHRKEDLDFLLPYGLPIIKIASIDLHYHQLLADLIPYKIPFLISTGMAYLSEIDETLRFLTKNKSKNTILLHCVSCYPPKPNETNLKNINTLHRCFNVPIGFSDHSDNIYTSIAAVALGACVIEKHITLDKKTPGPDHHFALEPEEMIELIKGVREVEASIGNYERVLSKSELESRKMIRRSIVSKNDLKKGQILTEKDIKYARPGTGITTSEFKYIEGRKLKINIKSETILNWNHFE